MQQIYIIHENDAWTAPLREELDALELPYEDWFLSYGEIDINDPPPHGVFYSRMSASSHTRGHRYATEYTAAVLAWLESHDRRVLNPSRALDLEISKVAQYTALNACGICTPRTIAVVGQNEIVAAARKFTPPFITKHNRGGKGLGVRLFHDYEALDQYVLGPEFDAPVDGITLIQEYIQAPQPYITRVEFVGSRFLYAVRVDTSHGFELCPAEVCDLKGSVEQRFSIINHFRHPIIKRYERFLRVNHIHIAGIEFITDGNGELVTYDINTNTNYNPGAEEVAGIYGMKAVARYLGAELSNLTDVEAKMSRPLERQEIAQPIEIAQ
ncbi:MAG: hypothetical protein QNI91_15305 [Arenicellales bacterium]|nr:hypothetical protein [Arenicellales bacterium]